MSRWANHLTIRPASLLPCDRDYLGTLGHLARATLLLGALDYASVLYRLLTPYPEAFAGHLDFRIGKPVARAAAPDRLDETDPGRLRAGERRL